MITLNNKKFAETEKEMIDSLFHKGGTCTGYAKRLKRSVKIMDHQYNLIGIINKHGVMCCATPIESIDKERTPVKKNTGNFWYSYADIDLIGYGPDSFKQQIEDIEKLIVKADHLGKIFK